MGAGVNRHEVVLTPELAKIAGFSVVLCRYLGPRQQTAIGQEMTRRQAETRRTTGEDWAARLVERVGPDDEKAHRERVAKLKRDDPTEWARQQWPDDLVCRVAIKARDGENDTPESIDEWLDDGPHPDVVREIAVAVLSASKLIPETEADRGEGSGGSSAVS